MITAPSGQLRDWVGRAYGPDECWLVVRDAYRSAGVDLPPGYYEAATRFTQVSDGPKPWDVVMLRTNPRAPILVLHAGLALDDKHFIQTWDGSIVLCAFDDERFSSRIAGYLRLYR